MQIVYLKPVFTFLLQRSVYFYSIFIVVNQRGINQLKCLERKLYITAVDIRIPKKFFIKECLHLTGTFGNSFLKRQVFIIYRMISCIRRLIFFSELLAFWTPYIDGQSPKAN
jgi:hypothetical protein